MRIRFFVLTVLFSSCLFGQRITKVVSAASGMANIAPGSIATIYGDNLAGRVESANGTPLPTELAGVRVAMGWQPPRHLEAPIAMLR